MEKIRKRNWRMLLYPEDSSHACAMEKLKAGGYKYVACLHDHDVWAEGESEKHAAGEPKKEHWHVVLKFPQARWNTAVADELGIQCNYLETCVDFDSACLYLLHLTQGDENKYQYEPSALFGTLVPHVNKLLDDSDEGTRVLAIVKEIDSRPGKASYRDLLVWACTNGYYGEFRRLGSGITALIKEHNEEYYGQYVDNSRTAYDIGRFQRFLDFTGDKDIIPL